MAHFRAFLQAKNNTFHLHGTYERRDAWVWKDRRVQGRHTVVGGATQSVDGAMSLTVDYNPLSETLPRSTKPTLRDRIELTGGCRACISLPFGPTKTPTADTYGIKRAVIIQTCAIKIMQ